MCVCKQLMERYVKGSIHACSIYTCMEESACEPHAESGDIYTYAREHASQTHAHRT
jgi:hypothetical protein